ncbi:MAG: prepilin-type N-terminal cleavage/methylation domain-containing protein [Candidatus Wallbacteria bacterium]|nr:prepilin-type N-terminal cleavage/methylation domain-containing protein [Candidatus Wallbacteria bacterium]
MRRRGFTLVEIMVSVLILALFFGGLYTLISTINRSSELVRWKSESQLKVRKFFKDYMEPDINKASYPSTVTEHETMINGGVEPTKDMMFQYLKAGNTDNKMMADSIGNGTVLMKWQINYPSVKITSTGYSEPGGTVLCEVLFYQKPPNSKRKNCIVYHRESNIPGEILPVNDVLMVDNIEYVAINHMNKFSDKEIDLMNIVPNSIHAGNEAGTNIEEGMADYADFFHRWKNSGTVTIEIGMKQDRVLDMLFGKSRFRCAEKISVKTNVKIETF